VLEVEIFVRETSAIVTYDSSKVTIQDMIAALEKAGFSVKGNPKFLK
jgi:copper chaperone CopZ